MKSVRVVTTTRVGGVESLSPRPPGEGQRRWWWGATLWRALRVDHVTIKKMKGWELGNC